VPETEPRPPRRLFLAALLAAAAAGGATALAIFGSLTGATTETFRFSRGTTLGTGEEARLRGFLAAAAQDDRLAVVIIGHTGTQGDAQANIALSESRAEAVAGIARDMGIDARRIRASGAGGGAPAPREAGQSERAYETDLARADVTLQVRR
jgi:outer membrane protein OmpA-like peptidoglycan-associated protein